MCYVISLLRLERFKIFLVINSDSGQKCDIVLRRSFEINIAIYDQNFYIGKKINYLRNLHWIVFSLVSFLKFGRKYQITLYNQTWLDIHKMSWIVYYSFHIFQNGKTVGMEDRTENTHFWYFDISLKCYDCMFIIILPKYHWGKNSIENLILITNSVSTF